MTIRLFADGVENVSRRLHSTNLWMGWHRFLGFLTIRERDALEIAPQPRLSSQPRRVREGYYSDTLRRTGRCAAPFQVADARDRSPPYYGAAYRAFDPTGRIRTGAGTVNIIYYYCSPDEETAAQTT